MWSDNEHAFILCCIDFCKDRGVDYRSNILNALKQYSGREMRRVNSIDNRLRKTFRVFGNSLPSIPKLLAEGTACLSVEDLSQEIRTSMERLHADWKSGQLTLDLTNGSKKAAGAGSGAGALSTVSTTHQYVQSC